MGSTEGLKVMISETRDRGLLAGASLCPEVTTRQSRPKTFSCSPPPAPPKLMSTKLANASPNQNNANATSYFFFKVVPLWRIFDVRTDDYDDLSAPWTTRLTNSFINYSHIWPTTAQTLLQRPMVTGAWTPTGTFSTAGPGMVTTINFTSRLWKAWSLPSFMTAGSGMVSPLMVFTTFGSGMATVPSFWTWEARKEKQKSCACDHTRK